MTKVVNTKSHAALGKEDQEVKGMNLEKTGMTKMVNAEGRAVLGEEDQEVKRMNLEKTQMTELINTKGHAALDKEDQKGVQEDVLILAEGPSDVNPKVAAKRERRGRTIGI